MQASLLQVARLALVLALACTAVAQDTPPTSEVEPEPIRRVAVVGASASAGFGIVVMKDSPIGRIPGAWTLARTLRTASRDAIVVIDLGSSMFFLSPQETGQRLFSRAIQVEPDLVVAIDFLFWYCYGNQGVDGSRKRTLEERMRMLEVGLAVLDTYEGPIVVGDIPDMSGAIGRMLSRSQVPRPDALAALNARIRAWADERPRARVFPLSEVIEKLGKGEPFFIGEHEWDARMLDLVLQRDQLHPTIDGQIALVQVLDHLLREDAELSQRMPPLQCDHETLDARIRRKPGTSGSPESTAEPASEPPASPATP